MSKGEDNGDGNAQRRHQHVKILINIGFAKIKITDQELLEVRMLTLEF